MLIVCLALALIFSAMSSEIINGLYQKKPDILSFPADIVMRRRARLPILFVVTAVALSLGTFMTDFSALLTFVLMAAFMAIVICTDFEQQVIFDRVLVPFALLSLPFFFVSPDLIGDRILAAIVGGAIFFLLAVITKGGIGGGDIKLIFVLGLWLGSDKLFFVAVCGTILAGLVAVIMLAAKKQTRRDFMAYGPYFAASAIVACYL